MEKKSKVGETSLPHTHIAQSNVNHQGLYSPSLFCACDVLFYVVVCV